MIHHKFKVMSKSHNIRLIAFMVLFPAVGVASVLCNPVSQDGSAKALLRSVESNVSRNEKLDYPAAFEKVWQAVRDKFFDPHLHGVDWNRAHTKYASLIRDVRSKSQFAALMNEMLGTLHASHTAYFTDDDLEYALLPSVFAEDYRGHLVEHIGVTGRPEDDAFLVTGVLDGAPAARSGILVGDRILTADGEPFTTLGSFRGREGRSVHLELMHESEHRTQTVTVTPIRENIVNAFLNATRASARILEVEGHRIGYVHLWTMAGPPFRELLDALVLGKLHDTEGLILDLRDGFGGIPWGYSDVFFNPDVRWETSSHDGGRELRSTGYRKPLVVLVNAGTRSAKEFLAYELQSSHRAVLVGTRTAGAFLGAGCVRIGADGLLELAELGLKVDGRVLEGAGVVPDIEVGSRAPYTDHDGQRARGEEALLQLIEKDRHAPRWRPVSLQS